MAFYVVEEDVWKCPKHPSKRRRSGICPTCLRDRLNTLCPDCANVRPCSCCSTTTATTTTSSSSSSSSSFSLFSDVSKSGRVVGRVSSLIDSEPSFRRSRSVAIPFLRSRFSGESVAGSLKPTPPGTNRTKSSFWSVFKTQSKNNRGEEEREDEELKKKKKSEIEEEDDYRKRVMMRSRSVSVPVTSNSGAGESRSSATKGMRWQFPSPISVFRHSKTSKVVQERSPLYRG